MSRWVSLQHQLPQRAITAFFGALCACQVPWLKNALIRRFMKVFPVKLEEASSQHLDDYPHFNAFFSRQLKPGVRPLAPAPALISPVDGFISSMGYLSQNQIFQAKGHQYTTEALLGDPAEANLFSNGSYATLYLSPADYHRAHTPLDAKLKSMRFIPGDLYSVNPETVAHCPNLFARNERLVTLYETAYGPMAIVLVGALNVGSMFTAWHPEAVRASDVKTWEYQDIELQRGDEVGGFLMGSTVILLLPEHVVTWENLAPQSPIMLGQPLGRLNS